MSGTDEILRINGAINDRYFDRKGRPRHVKKVLFREPTRAEIRRSTKAVMRLMKAGAQRDELAELRRENAELRSRIESLEDSLHNAMDRD